MTATIIHGPGLFSDTTYCGNFDALTEPGCTTLEIFLVDLDDVATFPHAYEYVKSDLVNVNQNEWSLALVVAVQLTECRQEGNMIANGRLRDLAALVPTVYAGSQQQINDVLHRLALFTHALQEETLCTLHLSEVKEILGSCGLFCVYGGNGTGVDRVQSAWSMATESAGSQEIQAGNTSGVVALLSGVEGDMLLNESRALEKLIDQQFEGLTRTFATSYGATVVGSLQVTLLLATGREGITLNTQ